MRLPHGGVKFLGAFLQDRKGEVIEQNTLGQGDALETIQPVHGPVREFVHGRHGDASHQTAVTHHGTFTDVHVISQTIQRHSIIVAVLGDIRYLLRLEGIILEECMET